MATMAKVRYQVSCETNASSAVQEYEVLLSGGAEKAYLAATARGSGFSDDPALRAALAEAEREIETIETEKAVQNGDHYVCECLGRVPMDPDDLTLRMLHRERQTLEYYGLQDAPEWYAYLWDAREMHVKLPLVCEFVEDFIPLNPFEDAWSLRVWWAAEDEDPEEEERNGQ